MNGSNIEIDVHRLSDGGLLLSYDGSSHTTYMKEEVDRQEHSHLFIGIHRGFFFCFADFSSNRSNCSATALLSATRLAFLRRRKTPRCWGLHLLANCCSIWWKMEITSVPERPMQRLRWTLISRVLIDFLQCAVFILLILRVLVSGDEDGNDIECAAVWLYLLCQKTRCCPAVRLYHGPHGAGWSQQHPSSKKKKRKH